MSSMVETTWQPRIVAFVCNWCTYAGADLAGTSRMEYPATVRLVRLPCTGRIDPLFVLKAFEQGADGVLISGCHPGDCHYVSGNLAARRRNTIFRKLMEFVGLDLNRLHFAWVSASEAVKWVSVVRDVTAAVRAAGPHGAYPKPRLSALNGRPRVLQEVPPPEAAQARELPRESIHATLTQSLRTLARDLLAKGEVAAVVGYAPGTQGDKTTPVFVRTPEEAESLVWNDHCTGNLSVYLKQPLATKLGKLGIVAKGCDVRSIVGLIQENQLSRDQVAILGVECPGVLLEGRPAAKCLTCQVRMPHLHDHLVSADGAAAQAPLGTGEDPLPLSLDEEVTRLERLSSAERWEYWQKQFQRCVRCYACRAVCPFCYCQRCITDQTRPQWVPPSSHPQGNFSWNVIRAYHLAGRCVECGECTRACPVNIRLDLLNRKVAREVEEQFGYHSGLDPDAAPPLATFRMEDEEDFIR